MRSFTSESRHIDHGISAQEGPNQDHETLGLSEETMTNPPHGLFKNDDPWLKNKTKKKRNPVYLEGYVETADEDELGRTKSLTDEDLEELKGCLDLGFGFSYDEIPELCNTLPALELCYSMSQKFLDEHQKSPESLSDAASSTSSPIANWKISSPGDHPEDVKARLKFWAQAVACTVKLCS
ncbi:unnamed protein product [Ilex paraguariensis]|uniref:Signal transducer/transcription protein n=1 Tax=Ilex paraguariensis TaxID=185542 RepID=A0ABC8RG48_9AQUA